MTDIRGVDLNLLGPLAVLLEERHVSRAAERAAMSQPAMSRALRKLRGALDDELLVRSAGEYRLTARAERIQRQLSEILPRLESLLSDQPFDPRSGSRVFRLAGTDYVISVTAPALVRRVRSESPGSTLRFQAWHPAAHEDAERGVLDVVLTGGAAPPPLRSEPLFEDRYVCALAAGHPCADRSELTLDAYLASGHVVVDVRDGRQGAVDQRLDALGRPRRAVVTVPYHAVTVDVVRGTDLIATLPERLAVELVTDDTVAFVGAPAALTPVTFSMGWHPRLDDDPAQRWLRDMLRAAGAREEPALPGDGQRR